MGLSVSAASAILFSAFIIVFGAMFGAINSYQDKIQAAQDDSYARALDLQNSEISIIEVNITNSTILVSNLGNTILDLNNLDVLINGTLNRTYVSSMEIEAHPGSGLWLPNENLIIQMTVGLAGAHIKIVTGSGAMAVSL